MCVIGLQVSRLLSRINFLTTIFYWNSFTYRHWLLRPAICKLRRAFDSCQDSHQSLHVRSKSFVPPKPWHRAPININNLHLNIGLDRTEVSSLCSPYAHSSNSSPATLDSGLCHVTTLTGGLGLQPLCLSIHFSLCQAPITVTSADVFVKWKIEAEFLVKDLLW